MHLSLPQGWGTRPCGFQFETWLPANSQRHLDTYVTGSPHCIANGAMYCKVAKHGLFWTRLAGFSTGVNIARAHTIPAQLSNCANHSRTIYKMCKAFLHNRQIVQTIPAQMSNFANHSCTTIPAQLSNCANHSCTIVKLCKPFNHSCTIVKLCKPFLHNCQIVQTIPARRIVQTVQNWM